MSMAISVSASNQHVTYTFSYDALNRLTSVQDSRYPQPTQYTYDRAGRRKTMTGPDGGITSYTYTLHGHVESITGPGGQSIQFEYDPVGKRSRTRRSNGTQTTYTYDAAGFVNTIQHLGPDGGVLEQFAYTYDKAGNRTSMTDSSGAHTYGYDDRYQLVAAAHPDQPEERYTYDAAGNRLRSAAEEYSYDAANRIVAVIHSHFLS